MKSLILVLCLLFSFSLFAVDEKWDKEVDLDDSSAGNTFTSKWDVDDDGDEAGETRAYGVWNFFNGDTTAEAYCTISGSTVLADGTRSRSHLIPPGASRKFGPLRTKISAVTCICESGQTCDDFLIAASD